MKKGVLLRNFNSDCATKEGVEVRGGKKREKNGLHYKPMSSSFGLKDFLYISFALSPLKPFAKRARFVERIVSGL